MRRDLVANASHELRTPIAALQSTLENMADGIEAPDRDALRGALEQVERLGRLVTQLLDLSRLEAGAVALERRQFTVRRLLDRVAAEARLRSGGIEIDVRSPGGLVARGDAERMHQVVANLVDNAVRHSPAGAAVVVEAGRGGDGRVRIEVSDAGPGIPVEARERVFERFYRTDAARSGDGGAGLGLAIVRWIVRLHGGDVRAEGGDPAGCRMVVTLPGALESR
jgi:signal transduction histidine kinase